MLEASSFGASVGIWMLAMLLLLVVSLSHCWAEKQDQGPSPDQGVIIRLWIVEAPAGQSLRAQDGN